MTRSGSIRVLAALALAATTAGCFQPLYGEAANPGVVEALHEVEVAPIPERMGHYLSDELISRMNGTGVTPVAKYRLTVKITKSVQTPTIESQIQTADSATVIGSAFFTLTRIDSPRDKLLYSGTATNSAVYDRTLQNFADLRANRDAEIRIAKSLADEIELRVASVLSQPK